MQDSDVPVKFQIPWGNSAGGAYIRPIPKASQIGIQDGAASLTDGFPPKTLTSIPLGGVPPFGQDANGILKQITQWNQWQQAGGPIAWDSTFGTAVGGYPKGAIVKSSTTAALWISVVNNNLSDPDTGTNWLLLPLFDTFETRAKAASAVIPSSVSAMRTLGYSVPGKGAATYKHASGTTPGGFQSADGQWWQIASNGVIDPMQFGAVGDGTTDDLAAFVAAIAYLLALPTGGMIMVPPSKYKISAKLTGTIGVGQSFTVRGCGQDASIIFWPNANGGFELTETNHTSSVHFFDITVTTGVANGGNGIKVTQNSPLGSFEQNDFVRLTLRGDDGGATTFYWTAAITTIGVSGVNADAVTVFGTSGGTVGVGIGFAGNPSVGLQYAVVCNLSRCSFFGVGNGFVWGTLAQGVTIDQCNFTNGLTGIFLPGSSAGATQLSVTSSQFNVQAGAISLDALIATIFLTNNLVYISASQVGFDLKLPEGGSVYGNLFVWNPLGSPGVGTGIEIGDGVTVGSQARLPIVGNEFQGLATGISVLKFAQMMPISANEFFQCAIAGIHSDGSFLLVTGNIFNGCAKAAILDADSTFSTFLSNRYTTGTDTITNAGTANILGLVMPGSTTPGTAIANSA